MNIDLKQLPGILKDKAKILRGYAVFIFVLAVLLAYSFLVLKISQLSQAEPDPDTVTQQANTIKRLKVDQTALEKIQELEDQNIAVQSLFEAARDNPFQN